MLVNTEHDDAEQSSHQILKGFTGRSCNAQLFFRGLDKSQGQGTLVFVQRMFL